MANLYDKLNQAFVIIVKFNYLIFAALLRKNCNQQAMDVIGG